MLVADGVEPILWVMGINHDELQIGMVTTVPFPRFWLFLWGIHRSPVKSPHKGRWRGALMFYLICAWTSCWVHNRDAGDLRRHRAHYDITVMRVWHDTHIIITTLTQDIWGSKLVTQLQEYVLEKFPYHGRKIYENQLFFHQIRLTQLGKGIIMPVWHASLHLYNKQGHADVWYDVKT